MLNADSDNPIAIIHRGPTKPGEHPLSVLNKGINSELISALERLGIDAVIARGLGSYSLNGAQIYLPAEKDIAIPKQQLISLQEIDVIRDIAGAFKDPSDIVVANVEKATTVVNGSSVRRGDNKRFITENDVFQDRQVTTIALTIGDSLSAIENLIKESFEGQNVVFAKPADSFGSKGLYRIDLTRQLDDTIAQIIAEAGGKEYVIQALIDNTIALPESIKPETPEQAAIMEKYKDAPKELRLFWFYGKGHDLVWLPTLRLTEAQRHHGAKVESTDYYAFIDPDTVPSELIEFSDSVLADFANLCKVSEMSGAIDYAYGKVRGEPDPKWYVMEGNFWQPVPPSKKENATLRNKFVSASADQLARIARANKEGRL